MKLKDLLLQLAQEAVWAREAGLKQWHTEVADSDPATHPEDPKGVVEAAIGSPPGLAVRSDHDGPLALNRLTLDMDVGVECRGTDVYVHLHSRPRWLRPPHARAHVTLAFEAQPIPEAVARIRDQLALRVDEKALHHLHKTPPQQEETA